MGGYFYGGPVSMKEEFFLAGNLVSFQHHELPLPDPG
jgi:hypothetical protein